MSGFPTDRFGRLYDPTTGSIMGFVDTNGNEQLCMPSVGTLAQMLATKATPGMLYRTTDTMLVNGAVSPVGNDWVYDGAQWRPRGQQRLLIDTTIVTGAKQTAEQIIKTYNIKAGLLYLQRFELQMTIAKNGATDGLNQLNVRLGPAGTTGDSFLGQTSTNVMASAKRSVAWSCHYECTDSATIIKHGTGGGIDNNSYTGVVAGTVVQTPFALTGANLQTTDQKLTFATSMTAATTDSPQVATIVLILHP